MKDLTKEWALLANVPIDSNDCIEETFLHFEKGTDKTEVWRWFDNHHIHGVASLMGVLS